MRADDQALEVRELPAATPRWARWIWRSAAIGTAALAAAVVGWAGWTVGEPGLDTTGLPVDLAGNVVVPEEDALPGAAEATFPELAGKGRFVVEAVGLDVPLAATDEVGGRISPPGFTSAYLVRNRGVALDDAARGTIFIAVHSLRGGGVAPGNFLIDVPRQRAAVAPGDAIRVGSLRYTVTRTRVFAKAEVPTQSSIWASEPGRLVVITCLQNREQTPSGNNLVIEAHLDFDAPAR